jgi:cell division protein FtsB
MAEFDLNLSTRPFPAYRLNNIALVLVLIVLAVVSVWQAQGFLRYSKQAQSIRAQEQESRIEADALAKRVAELESRLDRPESTAKLNEISFLNHIILQKEFSWTKLVGVLEEMMPDNVHLTTLTPDIAQNGKVTLQLGVRARTMADITQFLERVENSQPLFEDVKVRIEEKTDADKSDKSNDVDVTMSAVYKPAEGPMNAFRRKRKQNLFASLLGVIAVVNLLFFLILYRPARSEYSQLLESIQKARGDIQARRQKIERLEKLNAQLETSAQDRKQLLTMHFIPKSTGWSEILPQLDAMVQSTGVKNTRKDYAPSNTPQYGLYSVKNKVTGDRSVSESGVLNEANRKFGHDFYH